MDFRRFILERPLILLGIPIVFIGILWMIVTPQNLQLIILAIVYLIFILAFIFSGIITYQLYKKYQRRYDLLIVPSFLGTFFICITVILMGLSFG
jgi:hypothetical protein